MKRKHQIYLGVMLLSLVLLFSTNMGMAASKNHGFSISEGLDGFSARNAELTYETVIVKEGGAPGSVRVTLLADKTYGNLIVKDSSLDGSHPDWIADWTPYSKISAWIYFDELDSVPDSKGVAIRLGGNKATQVQYAKWQLKVGWNYIEADIFALVDGQASKLANMDGLVLEFIVDKTGMYIIDDIQLVKASN